MSNTLTLNCWVLGDGPNHIFTVKIEHTETVSILRCAIKDETKRRFHDLDADDLELWQVSDRRLRSDADDLILRKVNIDSNHPHLLNSIEGEGGIKGGVKLNPTTRLSKVFTDGPEDEHIHIVVRHPTVAPGGHVEHPADINMVTLNTGKATPTGF